MKTAIYTRVSTEEQAKEGYSLEVQREHLEAFAKQKGYEIFKVYSDEGISGYVLERPALKKLIEDAKYKEFDLVLVYKIDRFSRNLKDLLNLADELSCYGIGFKSATEAFDTSTSAGRMMLQQLGSFAEFERNRRAGRPPANTNKAAAVDNKCVSDRIRFDYYRIVSMVYPKVVIFICLVGKFDFASKILCIRVNLYHAARAGFPNMDTSRSRCGIDGSRNM